MTTNYCTCSEEAEILYRMYRTMGTLTDAEWTGQSMCCNDEEVKITISGHTVTIEKLDGSIISTYTHPENSTETFEQTTETLPNPFVRVDGVMPVTII